MQQANDILISIVRYIHSKYDHEIDPNAKILPVLLEKVIKQFDDPVLHEYWNEYVSCIESEKEQVQNVDYDTESEDDEVDSDEDDFNLPRSGGLRQRFREYKEERKKRGR